MTLAAIAEDSGARLITQAELLSNANDVDGDALTAGNLAISAGAGSLVDNGDGQLIPPSRPIVFTRRLSSLGIRIGQAVHRRVDELFQQPPQPLVEDDDRHAVVVLG